MLNHTSIMRFFLILLFFAFLVGMVVAFADDATTGNYTIEDQYLTILDPVSVGKQAASAAGETLSADEKADILFMREEEKLARDSYSALYNVWNQRTFTNIGAAEKTHMESLGVLITRYGLVDPVGNDVPGVFENKTLQELYDDLITKGKVSLIDGLKTGALIEEVDIRDLEKAIFRTDKPDIILVYEALMRGSRNHLRAFSSVLSKNGETYIPQVLNTSEYDSIIKGSVEKGQGL